MFNAVSPSTSCDTPTITEILAQNECKGNTCLSVADLQTWYENTVDYLSAPSFDAALHEQLQAGTIHYAPPYIYLSKTWDCENTAAAKLAQMLQSPPQPPVTPPVGTDVNGIPLCAEQLTAVSMALSHRLSVICGGAGTGKTTLIQAILKYGVKGNSFTICAPTGKAARNLTTKTGCSACTVHYLHQHANWPFHELIVVDEASMMTLEMLAWVLSLASPSCHVVLIGDSNQLPSVGAGNVLFDLQALGFAHYSLRENHRQSGNASALQYNVTNFPQLASAAQLSFDDSFQFIPATDISVRDQIADTAAALYLSGASAQVITPFNNGKFAASVAALNLAIQQRVNPPCGSKPSWHYNGITFQDGDRVLITQNSRDGSICNGDIGTLSISVPYAGAPAQYSVHFEDGRQTPPTTFPQELFKSLSLAYAVTIYKAQGSEYDTVIVPFTRDSQFMMTRNLIYTAISRAKQQVLLFGDWQTIDSSMLRWPPQRTSTLVEKTRMMLHQSV